MGRLAATILLLIAATGCGTTPPATQATTAGSAATPATTNNKPRPRDLETYLVLFDLPLYRSKIAPALDKYVESGDSQALAALAPGIALAADATDRKQRLQAALAAAPAVVEAKCLVRLTGIAPYQLGEGELVSYLYSASDWLRETLTSKDISDLTLEYPLGEHTEIIRPNDAAEIRVNMRNVPAPEDAAVKAGLASLLAMMDAAARNPEKYALALIMK